MSSLKPKPYPPAEPSHGAQPADSKQAAKQARDRERARQILVEQIIQEAMANGAFDNLPGKGKPLKFEDNPYLEPGQELAYGLLKNNGFAPEWIERNKDIRRDMARLRQRLRRAWQQRSRNESKWQAAIAQFEAELVKLNRKIDDFNLIAPSVVVQRPRLRLDNELQRVKNNLPIDTD